MSDTAAGPLLRVVKGEPTDEELAALVVALTTQRLPVAAPPPGTPTSGWTAPEQRLRRTITAGPGAWRASARPR